MASAHHPLPHFEARRVDAHGLSLSVLDVGDAAAPAVVMTHGLRDTAHALLPIAGHLADRYRVLVAELRGHGASARSDAYAMPNFLLDLHAVITGCASGGPCALFGHSLGGHIATKYAALFPEQVAAAVIVEGLGPPRRPHEGDEQAELAAYRSALLTRMIAQNRGRPLADLAEAAERLGRNNPRLHPDEAERLAPHLTEDRDGELRWAFDSRANGVFVGTSQAENRKFWRNVQAPTCIVSGALSYEYWGSQMHQDGFTGRFAEGELEARAADFPNAEHHWFEHSGHMVHYDEPDRLGRLCREFLEKHYV